MRFLNSKKYGSAVQHYEKVNGEVSYFITFKDEDNKLRRVKIGDKSAGITEPYCHQKRIEILNQIRLGEEPPALARKRKKRQVTLNEIADIYFKQREVHAKDNTKSLQKYQTKLKTEFGETPLTSIGSDEVLAFQTQLKEEGYAPATINYNITFLGTLFNLAIDEGKFPGPNPVKNKKIKKLKTDNERDRYLSTEEVYQLLEAVDDDEATSLFVRLSLSTGGRLETILNIKKKDINLSDRIITLKDLKNGTTYKGFFGSELLEYLSKYLKTLRVNSFVIGGKSEKYATRTIQRRLKTEMDRLFNQGLSTRDAKNRVVVHTLRHTFASHLAINGTPIYTIQRLMNHNDINMTLRYAKLAPDSGRDFVDKLFF